MKPTTLFSTTVRLLTINSAVAYLETFGLIDGEVASALLFQLTTILSLAIAIGLVGTRTALNHFSSIKALTLQLGLWEGTDSGLIWISAVRVNCVTGSRAWELQDTQELTYQKVNGTLFLIFSSTRGILQFWKGCFIKSEWWDSPSMVPVCLIFLIPTGHSLSLERLIISLNYSTKQKIQSLFCWFSLELRIHTWIC